MDLETPVDAWYVYVAVAVVSVALAGLALGVSTGPPPDANSAANAIEGVTGSEYAATASYEHDAQTVTVDQKTITLENDRGTTHASFSYGIVVPVNGYERLENLTLGSSFADEYGTALADPDRHAVETFTADVEHAFEENAGEPLQSNGDLRARRLLVDSSIDDLEPLRETAIVEVSETASLPGEGHVRENVRAVRLDYNGVEDREVTFAVEGTYAGSGYLPDGDFEESATESFDDGSGSIELEIRSGTIDRPGLDPVEFRVAFAGEELPAESWESDDLGVGDRRVWTNEIDREADIDDDHPALGVTDGGNYHVALVRV